MKILLAVVLAVYIFSANAQVEKLQSINKEAVKTVFGIVREKLETCAKEHKAKQADVERILKLKIPKSRAGKCILFCINRDFNGQNADGTSNLKGALKTINIVKHMDKKAHKKLTEIFTKCESVPPHKDPCVRGANIVACLFKEARKLGMDKLIAEAVKLVY